jgi:hypothetical protein
VGNVSLPTMIGLGNNSWSWAYGAWA